MFWYKADFAVDTWQSSDGLQADIVMYFYL